MTMPTPPPRLLLASAALMLVAGIGAVATREDPSDLSPTATSAPTVSAVVTTEPTGATAPSALRGDLARLERRRDGRVGLVAIDTETGDRLAYRADERFALASTVKVLLAAALLDELSATELERRLHWTEADLVPNSPITEMFVAEGMTVRQLIDAAITLSDNTATNVLFRHVGGPAAVDAWVRRAGDSVTSVDRIEPDLNDWAPGEVRDTSTPRALAQIVAAITRGTVLSDPDRTLLNDELGDSLTGARLVRAAVPPTWQVADKSGSAAYGTRNNVAVVYPPGRGPWVVVVMTSHQTPESVTDDVLVSRAARLVVEEWS